MADIRDALRQLAIQIRDEHRLGANTAKRVGSLLLALVDSGVEMDVLEKIFLRKDQEDTAQELIRFLKGLVSEGLIKALGGIEVGENGSGITALPDGTSQAVVDRLYVKVKAIFDELEVKKKSYVGGEQVLSPAGMKCIKVEELTDAFRCFLKVEEDGVKIENQFTIGTLAIAQENNIKVGVSHHVGNRYYWRLVTGVGADYIDLSKTECDPNVENDLPAAGDDIVGLGHSTDIARQGAIVLSSVNEVAPSIIMYQGINDFSLVGKDVIGFDFDKSTGKARMRVYGEAYIGAKDRSSYIEYTEKEGVSIKAKLEILPGTTGLENIADLEIGKVNLLRNSGFTGDYDTTPLEVGTQLSPDTELYSQSLKYWAATNVDVNVDNQSQSERSVTLNTGLLIQTLPYKMLAGEKYVISFKAKGSTVSVSCGGLEDTQVLTADYQRYIYKFCATAETEFTVSGNCTICELQLERGTIVSGWSPSLLDSNKAEAKFEALKYLIDVITGGSTDVIGGLILSSMLQVGNYVDGKMKEVTGGLSGVYNDADDVLLWGDGDLEKAIRTVMACKDNPAAFLNMTEEELANYAKIVLTHGGRAILNDVIVRGYVYALGGYFKGTVEIANGKILLNEDGSGQLANGTLLWDSAGILYRRSHEVIIWREIAEEIANAHITDTYNIDMKMGTYLKTAGIGTVCINLPDPALFPGMTIEVYNPARTRVPISFLTIKCDIRPIQAWNKETLDYDNVMIGEPISSERNAFINNYKDNDGFYYWRSGDFKIVTPII